MAQLVEHILGKDEVPGPNPGSSSRQPRRKTFGALVFYKLLQTFVGAFSLWGLSGAATLHFGSGSVPKVQIRSAYLSGDLQACLQGEAKSYLRSRRIPGAAPALSLRLGHVREKTVINCFFTLSCRFATRRETFGALVFYKLLQTFVGAFSLWGLSGVATLRFGSGSVEKAQIRYAYLGKSKKPRKLSGTFLICSCNYLNNRFYCFCGSKNRENS